MNNVKEVKHNVGPTLSIAIPTLGRPVPLEWALNFKSMSPPINFNCDFNIIYGREIGYARNALAKAALERGCKYIFFLGDDVVAPPHTIRQLIYRMENHPKVDVVGGVYCAKADPPAPLVFVENGQGSYWDWKIGEFFPCTGLGMDCTLIRTELFTKIPEPWFKTVDIDKHIDGQNGLEAWTEDLYFLQKAREVGAGIFCDASIICEHWDVYQKKAYKLPSDSLPMRVKGVEGGKKKCLMLGPKLDIDPQFSVVRCSEAPDRECDYRITYDSLPFDAEEFDFICVTEPLLDVERHLEEFNRVLKVDGNLAFTLNEQLNPLYFIDKKGFKANGSFLEKTKDTKTETPETP